LKFAKWEVSHIHWGISNIRVNGSWQALRTEWKAGWSQAARWR
jgi:hypothetical protein